MRENDHWVGVGHSVLSEAKEPAHGGLNPQDLEVVSGNEFHTNPAGTTAFLKVHARRNSDAGGYEVGEVGAGLPKESVERLGEIAGVQIEIIAGRADCKELPRLTYGKSPEKERVDKREHGCCAGYAQRDRRQNGGAEARMLSQEAQCDPGILRGAFQC